MSIDLTKYVNVGEDEIASFPPEELAFPLLAAIRDLREPFDYKDALKLKDGLFSKKRKEILFIMSESFAFLLQERLVVAYPPELHSYANKDIVRYRVSKRGRKVDINAGLEGFRKSTLLSRDLLHPSLHSRVIPAFQRRDYETAVFLAMKEVEIFVRNSIGAAPNQIGVPLMRQAFKSGGVLDKDFAVDSERQALSDLFAGAIGFFRNSTGHRNIDFEPISAARTILLASELLEIVEKKKNA